ncbi:hypothetical protein COCNU_10G004130 [Cocos nucifera]|uniref:Uncharacterized protein n=1 Tax=Cocos nucifera TaxID=13894 RepID=A0A8K0IM45_COCNU|nr:hypothetical protein COCNU_10G004130 [Cocos nucifera]
MVKNHASYSSDFHNHITDESTSEGSPTDRTVLIYHPDNKTGYRASSCLDRLGCLYEPKPNNRLQQTSQDHRHTPLHKQTNTNKRQVDFCTP